MTMFMVLTENAGGWVMERGVREQPLWDEHAVFMNRLFDDGKVLLGGPFGDDSGALVIVDINTDSPEQVQAMFESDPWVTGGLRSVASVKQWNIFLDARARRGR